MKLATAVLVGLGLIGLANRSAADLPKQTFTLTPDAVIPDANPAGWQGQFMVTGVANTVSKITLSLDIRGGYNSDLYAHLVSPTGIRAVLLNRTGITGINPFGYGDAGFNITLDSESAINIHEYGLGFSLNESGQVTGTYAADGRDIDPDSTGALFDSSPITAGLQLFNSLPAEDVIGIWTIFFSDNAGGAESSLHGLALEVVAVPEPSTGVSLSLGLALLLLRQRRR